MFKRWRKKLIVSASTIGVAIANDVLGIGIDPMTIIGILGASGLYAVGQGQADRGEYSRKRE